MQKPFVGLAGALMTYQVCKGMASQYEFGRRAIDKISGWREEYTMQMIDVRRRPY